jgi:hypothetical protein
MNEIDNAYKYHAFISYKSEDEKWAKRLQENIEKYRLPSYMCKKHPSSSKRLKPCFRYHTDIGINELKSELNEKLEKSKFLIVVCSPESAKSEWVGDEIETFVRLGRRNRIIPFIVEGVPYSDDENECLHPVIKELFPHSDSHEEDREILGANVNEEGQGGRLVKWNKAVVKVISKMQGLEFDELWQRERRRRIKKSIVSAIVCAAMLSLIGYVYTLSRLSDVHFTVEDRSVPNDQLPPMKNARLVAYVGDNRYEYTLKTLEDTMTVKKVSASLFGTRVRIIFHHDDYLPTDTTFLLYKFQTIGIRRNDSVYGNIELQLFDMNVKPLTNCSVTVQDYPLTTDSCGMLRCFIPLLEQRERYEIRVGQTTDSVDPTYNYVGQCKSINIE